MVRVIYVCVREYVRVQETKSGGQMKEERCQIRNWGSAVDRQIHMHSASAHSRNAGLK